MEITRELFEQQRRPRFGSSNPERIRNEFWEWMIRGDEGAPKQPEGSNVDAVLASDRKLKSSYGPHRARDVFQAGLDQKDGPIWTFDRMGASCTELPDGRLVCVGGEHEDFYDPDFCVYNDVVVFRSSEIEIYGYPKDVFPPTDFHTATLVDDRIIVIGSIGYPGDRRIGVTPVYELNLKEYRISEIQTWGDLPGWISEHHATIAPGQRITIRDGLVFEERDGNQRFRRNFEDYALDLSSRAWTRLTSRNWRQFRIRQEDRGAFVSERRPTPESLVPRGIHCRVVPGGKWNCCRIEIQGVQVSMTVAVPCVEVLVEGKLSDEICLHVAEGVRAQVEETIRRKCVLELL
jgi:hypothetical protein